MFKRTSLLLVLFSGTVFSAPEWRDADFFKNRGSDVDNFLDKSFKRLEYARAKMTDYWKRARKESDKKVNSAVKSAVKSAEKKASDTLQQLPDKLK